MYSKKAKVLIVVGLIAEITWGIRGYSLLPPSSEDLAQLVSEKGKPMIIENRMVIPHSYSLTKIIHDGVYQHTLNIQALSCEHKGRMEIRLTPTLGYDKTNLPFGYEITDWDCDGMNGESDDFRMYLGNDRWHHTQSIRNVVITWHTE